MTYADEIEKIAKEPILAIAIGSLDGWDVDEDEDKDSKGVPKERIGVHLSWSIARPLLDYDYDAGYGREDCHPVHVWTKDKIIFAACYDGSTWLSSVPRYPEFTKPAVTPIFHGGG